ncbi:MAG: hypothetical protein KGY42_00860 [Desulfobacterales bacterium]|nr:hypothetical protein [Desulfobacterales bacterium]MBS3754112.1 hypothetical protein [Desulfobacterales bacterium]
MPGFLTLAIMLAVAGAFSIYRLKTIGSPVQSLLDDNYRSINAAKKMTTSLEREDSGILLLLSGKWKGGGKPSGVLVRISGRLWKPRRTI